MSLPRPILCLILSTLTLLGCESSRTTTTRVPEGAEFKTGLPIEPGFAAQLGYNNRWVADLALGKGQSIHAVTQVGDRLIVVERPDNFVTALNLADGSLAWKVVVGNKLERLYAPVGDDQGIYVNTSRRQFTLDPRRGTLLNITNLDYPVDAGPYLVDNLAIFGSVAGEVFAFQVDYGYKRWAYKLPATIATPPVQDGLQVFAADTQGNYAMLNAENGDLLWRGNVYGPITAAPVIDRNFVIIASEDQSLYSLVAATGRFRWPPYRSEAPLVNAPRAIDRVIYVTEQGKGMTALDATTGQPQWTTSQVRMPLTMKDNRLIAFGSESLASIDPANGQVIREVPTRELKGVTLGPADSLILVARDGRLHRLDPIPTATPGSAPAN